MPAALQIGGFSIHEGRLWASALVLGGTVTAGDRLEAVGLARTPCVIDEVRVAGQNRPAAAPAECQLFLRDPDDSLRHNAAGLYFAFVTPGAFAADTRLRADLTWASLFEDRSPPPAYAPTVDPVTADTPVALRFGAIRLSATLKKPAVVLPPAGTQTWDLLLDRPLPLIPGFGFSMTINGQIAATGKVLPAAAPPAPSSSR